jgi:hypothetical protein
MELRHPTLGRRIVFISFSNVITIDTSAADRIMLTRLWPRKERKIHGALVPTPKICPKFSKAKKKLVPYLLCGSASSSLALANTGSGSETPPTSLINSLR